MPILIFSPSLHHLFPTSSHKLPIPSSILYSKIGQEYQNLVEFAETAADPPVGSCLNEKFGITTPITIAEQNTEQNKLLLTLPNYTSVNAICLPS
jgi:hypothetical protein